MKKNYVKPEFEAVEVEMITMVAASSGITEGETGGSGVGSGSAGNEDPDLAGGRRGSWGNRWE